LTIEDRERILWALDDVRTDALAELRGVLLEEHEWRAGEGLVQRHSHGVCHCARSGNRYMPDRSRVQPFPSDRVGRSWEAVWLSQFAHAACQRSMVSKLTSSCSATSCVGMSRIAATLLVVFGTLVVAFSPNRWDRVVLDLPRGHGVHGHDVIGIAPIAIAVAVFWREPVATAK
jgi:hypothetical protein